MDRRTALWVIVVFLGASLIFRSLQELTEDQPAGVSLAVQVVALAALVGVAVYAVRRHRGRR